MSGINRQRGVVLIIALIALVAMTLAAIGLVRSHSTGSLIAGNMAFKQDTLQATDQAFEMALDWLAANLSTTAEADVSNQYFALQQPVDPLGVPTTIDWNTVPCRTGTGAAVTCGSVAAGSNRIQYVIDRLCQGGLPVTDKDANCVQDQATGGGSKRAGVPVFAGTGMIYYRVTARVQGPRGTTTLAQAVVGFR
jgi:Tfp pilus assembly protein PilX